MTTLPLAEVRANLSKLVDDAESTHERYDITRNGRRAAVLLGASDFDELQETLAVLADQDLLKAHLAGVSEAAAGDVRDADGLAVALEAAGRPPRSR